MSVTQMQFLDLTLPTLAANLALDEALLLTAQDGGPDMLRLWEWPTCAVVLGAAGRLAEEVHADVCRADAVPIARRSSGGGTVLLGTGCFVYTLVLAYERAPELGEIRSSYCYILGRLCASLADLAAGLQPAGTSDLAIAGRKVSGNAQQRKRRHLLHHGTLLYGFALEKIQRYLPMPPRQPEYRQRRGHRDFVVNLGATRAELGERLRRTWAADTPASDWPAEMTRRLLAEKYSRGEWLRRR